MTGSLPALMKENGKMRCLMNLFLPQGRNVDRGVLLPSPIDFSARELDAIADALRLLMDTRPEWGKPFAATARAKIGVIKDAWSKYAMEHS